MMLPSPVLGGGTARLRAYAAGSGSAFQTGIYAKKNTPIKTWEDLRNRTVGVNRGSSVEREFTNREKELNLKILRFEDDATTMQALFSGQGRVFEVLPD